MGLECLEPQLADRAALLPPALWLRTKDWRAAQQVWVCDVPVRLAPEHEGSALDIITEFQVWFMMDMALAGRDELARSIGEPKSRALCASPSRGDFCPLFGQGRGFSPSDREATLSSVAPSQIFSLGAPVVKTDEDKHA